MRRAVKTCDATSSLTMTSIGGAPNSPSRSTSQPACSQQPVTRGGEGGEIRHLRARDEPDAPMLGKAEQLLAATQTTICSTTAAIGDMTNICAFWSQADTSQSAAVAPAGCRR